MIRRLLFVVFSALLVAYSAQAENHRMRISDFYAGASIVRLQGSVAELNLSVPLAGGHIVTDAWLDLRAVHSIALVQQRSVLSVRFNNATVGQIALDPANPNKNPMIALPAELWREGYNTLTFAVSQHYANQCVDGAAPELWTELDLYRSSLVVETTREDSFMTLAELSDTFNPGIGRQKTVSLLSADNAATSVILKALPTVAQALALRAEYQPLQFHFQHLPLRAQEPELPQGKVLESDARRSFLHSSYYLNREEEGIHVLVGTSAELKEFLSEDTFNRIKGAYLGVEKTPEIRFTDGTVYVSARHRLIMSGTQEREVLMAAEALALMDDELNPNSHIIIDGFEYASDFSPLSADILIPGGTYSLGDMGAEGADFRGERAFEKQFAFTMPADFYVPESATLEIYLDFAYGAGFGPGSAMNIEVNGELVHGLPLSNVNGQSFRNYQLNIPARHLKGGRNNIAVDVTMRPPVADVACDDIPGKYLHFQLLPTSRIEIPEAGSVARQPDLRLFAETAYPMAQVSGAEHADVYLSSHELMDSGLTLIGKLAQSAGTLIPSLQLHREIPAVTTDSAFILATPDSMPTDYGNAFRATLQDTKRWPYRLQNLLHNRLRSAAENKVYEGTLMHGITAQQSELGGLGVLLAQENPRSENTGTVFIFAADTAETMLARTTDLISPAIWGQLGGDFVVWENNETPSLVMQVADVYVIGAYDDVWLETRMWLTNHPWYWLIGFIAMAVFCALLAFWLLRRRNKKIQEKW